MCRVRTLRDTIQTRLAQEHGTIYREAPHRVALLYPSPYRVGMSSLGYQVIYRALTERPDTVAERAFAPDDLELAARLREPVLTYESMRPLGDHPLVAVSVAYEGELGSLIQTLQLAGIPPLREDRDPARHPFILMGGPLSFSNPVPLHDFADAVVIVADIECNTLCIIAGARGARAQEKLTLARNENVGRHAHEDEAQSLDDVA